MEYFKVETISPSIKSITDLTTVRSFLIEGEKAAVLVDTGTGVGHLAEFVKAITAKPLTVLCTHAHPDHMGAVEEFGEVYLNEEDFEMAMTRCGMDRRREYAGFILGEKADLDSLYFVPERTRGYQKLSPDMEFDLGGVTVKALAFPGHTQDDGNSDQRGAQCDIGRCLQSESFSVQRGIFHGGRVPESLL